jgi:hypothetical protein
VHYIVSALPRHTCFQSTPQPIHFTDAVREILKEQVDQLIIPLKNSVAIL